MSTWTGFKGGIEVIGLKIRDAASGLAVLIRIESIDGDQVEPPTEKWIPVSQIEAGHYNQITKEYKMMLPTWLADKLHRELI